MEMFFVILFTIASPLGIFCQQIEQTGSAIVRPSEQFQLTCTVSGFELTSFHMHLVRYLPNNRMEWIGLIWTGGDTRYPDSLRNKISITKDNGKKQVYLRLSNTVVDDTGMYYCAREMRGLGYYFDIWGPGTFVTVTSAESKGPSLFPLISCGTSQEKSTTIGCLAKDFLPGSIDFGWEDQFNKNYSIGFKQYNSVLQSGGTYAASSQIKVPTDGWENSDSYYCTTKHLDKRDSVLVHVPRVVARKPTVTIHPPIKDDVELNSNATIVCIASGFYPKNIQVSWKKNSEVIHEAVTEEAVSNGNGSFMITSYIVVSKENWDKDLTYSCIVTHDPSDFQEIKNVSKSSVCEPGTISRDIKVTVLPPSFETIFFQNNAPLTCIITNMESKDGLEVTWYANNEKITNTVIEDPVYDSSSRTYTAKAIATVCPEDWSKKNFKCSVSHPELPRVEFVPVIKPNGHKAPIILLYPPHPDELAKKETATLSCLVKGFTPADIFVKWIDSDNKEHSHVATTGPVKEITSSSKETYFLLSTLTLTSVQDWHNGKSYTCIVGHESLPLRIIQRSIDKTAGNPTNVNVSLVMSDSC